MSDKPTLRFDDGQLFVSIPNDAFDQRLRTLINEAELRDVEELCDTIVYCRGELPPTTSIWRERFYWLLTVVVIMLSIYGLVCLFDVVIEHFSNGHFS
jgi:hypothetical protein